MSRELLDAWVMADIIGFLAWLSVVVVGLVVLAASDFRRWRRERKRFEKLLEEASRD